MHPFARAFLWTVTSCGLALAIGCDGKGIQCEDIECVPTLTLNVRDASGGNVSVFKGDVTIDGKTTHVDCGSGVERTPQDIHCGDGTVKLNAPTPDPLPDSVAVKITSADGTTGFDGSVSPEKTYNQQPSLGDCVVTCQAGSATITLK